MPIIEKLVCSSLLVFRASIVLCLEDLCASVVFSLAVKGTTTIFVILCFLSLNRRKSNFLGRRLAVMCSLGRRMEIQTRVKSIGNCSTLLYVGSKYWI